MSQQLTKYQALIDACVPYNGERFSGTYITHDVKDYPDEVARIEEIGKNEGLTRYPTACWINVMRGKGARMEPHSEGYNLGDFTIVLFLNTLEESEGGLLVVEEGGANYTESFTPIEGAAVMFKSWQTHFVMPLNTDKPRITIAALFHT